MLRAVVVIDYQNVHLTASDVFGDRSNRHESLIHPVHFAKAGLQERNARQREGYPHAELQRVIAYRGLPHVDHDWEQHRRCQDQATQWRTDGAEVELRDLKYRYRNGADGRPVLDIHGKKEPLGPGREKGIDVLCALRCVREAMKDDVDLVILASRDSDLIPVLDEVHDMHREDRGVASIETFSWFNRDASKMGVFTFGNLRPSGDRRIWNTNLDRSCYEASLDRRDYR